MNKSEIATGHAVAAHFVASLVVLLKDKGVLKPAEASAWLLENIEHGIARLHDDYDERTKANFSAFFRGAAADLTEGRV